MRPLFDLRSKRKAPIRINVDYFFLSWLLGKNALIVCSSFEPNAFSMKVMAFTILFLITGTPLMFWTLTNACRQGISWHSIFSLVIRTSRRISSNFSSESTCAVIDVMMSSLSASLAIEFYLRFTISSRVFSRRP